MRELPFGTNVARVETRFEIVTGGSSLATESFSSLLRGFSLGSSRFIDFRIKTPK